MEIHPIKRDPTNEVKTRYNKETRIRKKGCINMNYQREKRILKRKTLKSEKPIESDLEKGPLTSDREVKPVLKRGISETEKSASPILKRGEETFSQNPDQIRINPRDTYQQSDLTTGRKIVLGIAIAILVIQCLDLLTYILIPGELISIGITDDIVPRITGSLVWVILTGVFLFHMYKGRVWAKVLIFIRLGMGALGTLVMVANTSYMLVEYRLSSIAVSGALGTFIFVLSLNKKVNCFFSHQDKVRRGVPVEVIPDLSMEEKYGDGVVPKVDGLDHNPILQKKYFRGKMGFIGLSLILVGSQIGYLISTAIVQGIYAYDMGYTPLLFLSGIIGVLMRGFALWFLYRGVLWLRFVLLTFAIVQTLYNLIAVFPPATENLFFSMILIESLLLITLWVLVFLLVTPSSIRIFIEGQKKKIAYNTYKKENEAFPEGHLEYKIQGRNPEKRGEKWLSTSIFVYGVVAVLQSFVAMMSYYEYAVYYSINPWSVNIEIFNPIITLGLLLFVWKGHQWAKYALVIVTLGLTAHSLYFISKGEVLLNQILTMIPILSLVALVGIILFSPSVQVYFQSLNGQEEEALKAETQKDFKML